MNKIAFSTATCLALRDRLMAAEPGLDEQTLADTIEGLTNLHEIVAAIVRSAIANNALSEGLRGRISEMQARLERLEDRASKRRQIARDIKERQTSHRATRRTLQRIGSDGRYHVVPHKTPLLDPALASIKTAKPNPTPRDRSVGTNVFGMPVTCALWRINLVSSAAAHHPNTIRFSSSKICTTQGDGQKSQR